MAIAETSIKSISIYALFDPLAPNVVRYVGKTNKPLSFRLRQHIVEAKRLGRSYRHKWINSLLRRGINPSIRLLLMASENDWQEIERNAIAECSKHWKLTNGTLGGEGLNATPEVREKLRLAKLGKKCPESVKIKLRLANLGKIVSEETISKMRKSQLGRRHSEQTRQKMRTSHCGKTLSLAHKESMRQYMLGKKLSRQTREKMRMSHLGFKHSETSKEKMCASWVLRKERKGTAQT